MGGFLGGSSLLPSYNGWKYSLVGLSRIWSRGSWMRWKESSSKYSREWTIDYSSLYGVTFQHYLFFQARSCTIGNWMSARLYALLILWTCCNEQFIMRKGTKLMELIGLYVLDVGSIWDSILTSISLNWVDEFMKYT